jgi:hypothetical protein
MRPVQKFVQHLPMLFVPVLWLLLACGLPYYSLPEVDAHFIDSDTLRGPLSTSEIIALLGEPPLILVGHGWVYPMRLNSLDRGQAVPAPVLKVFFDESGRVKEWGFYAQFTDEPLLIRETTDAAGAWLNRCSTSTRIELNKVLIVGVSTRQEVFNRFVPHAFFDYEEANLDVVFAPSLPSDKRVLHFYVDHPSPLYIPPDYYVFNFDDQSWPLRKSPLVNKYPRGSFKLLECIL